MGCITAAPFSEAARLVTATAHARAGALHLGHVAFSPIAVDARLLALAALGAAGAHDRRYLARAPLPSDACPHARAAVVAARLTLLGDLASAPHPFRTSLSAHSAGVSARPLVTVVRAQLRAPELGARPARAEQRGRDHDEAESSDYRAAHERIVAGPPRPSKCQRRQGRNKSRRGSNQPGRKRGQGGLPSPSGNGTSAKSKSGARS